MFEHTHSGQERSALLEGGSFGNALTKTVTGLYKAELIGRRARWKTFEAVELADVKRVSWFSQHRLLKPLGHIPPAETEANNDEHLSSHASLV